MVPEEVGALTIFSLLTGRGALVAPAALQQVRYSALQTIGQLACLTPVSGLWKGMCDKVAEAVVVYLDDTQTTAVQETAAQVTTHDSTAHGSNAHSSAAECSGCGAIASTVS